MTVDYRVLVPVLGYYLIEGVGSFRYLYGSGRTEEDALAAFRYDVEAHGYKVGSKVQ